MAKRRDEARLETSDGSLASIAAGVAGGTLLAGGLTTEAGSGLLHALVENHASVGEDLFIVSLTGVSLYALVEMSAMQMKCPHFEAKMHTTCSAVATLLALYGIVIERWFRESPGLWWGVLTPIVFTISNLTMTRLMRMYKGPIAYKRLFDLGQSFTLSFQGIHLLAWSSLYPELYWLVLPCWYYSLKKLVEPVLHLLDVIGGDDAGRVEALRRQDKTWGTFGLELDTLTLGFIALNFGAALADNAYMGAYTVRGPEAFFAESRALADTIGGSDHLRMALVKPAAGSLVVSISVFLGTLCARGCLPLAVGVPASALLSSFGPWLVFFWHRLADPSEPWLPELLGTSWGPGPLAAALGWKA